jgi:hypothetical protein
VLIPFQASCSSAITAVLLCQWLASPTLEAGEIGSRTGVRASFSFAPDERLLLVPVRLDGKDYQFIVDTGMTYSLFDSSLKDHLGQRVGDTLIHTNYSDVKADLYPPPNATVGSLRLTDDPVICHDLGFLREVTGYDVYGIIGLDFLDGWIIFIDFDDGRLDILSPGTTPDRAWGEKVHFSHKSFDCRYIPVSLGKNSLHSFFMLDTGCDGTGSLEDTLFSQHGWRPRIAARRVPGRQRPVARHDGRSRPCLSLT